jgi:hypothetical protein
MMGIHFEAMAPNRWILWVFRSGTAVALTVALQKEDGGAA